MFSAANSQQTSNRNAAAAEDEDEEDNPYMITEEMLRDRLNKQSTGKLRTQLYATLIGKFGNISVILKNLRSSTKLIFRLHLRAK